jgi:hypothetical protein
VLRAKKRTPTPSPSVVFTFGLTIQSIKELGGALTKKKTINNTIKTKGGFDSPKVAPKEKITK